ncbi:MAG: MopE-related protein, partial [Myxococcota bacterium]
MRLFSVGLIISLTGCAYISDSTEQERLDPDGDGVLWGTDCDNQDANVGMPTPWFLDLDGDSFGDPNNIVDACTRPDNGVENGDDCWDTPDDIPPDFVALNGLPQPTAAAVFPGASNAPYDGINQGCAETFNDFDLDGDGFNAAGYADRDGQVGDDCFDLDEPGYGDFSPEAVYPGAEELCGDGVDSDCDDLFDADDPDADPVDWFQDADDDGFGDVTISTRSCLQPSGFVLDDTDCNDADVAINPGADELAGDRVDQNCDGAELCFVDGDEDTFRTDATVSSPDLDCSRPGEALLTAAAGDCDDTDALVYPDADELL